MPVTSWGQTEEMQSSTAMFVDCGEPTGIRLSSSFAEPTQRVVEQATWGLLKSLFFEGNLVCSDSISLSMVYPPGEFTWVSIPAPPPFVGETWYEKIVDYTLTIEADGTLYTSGGPLRASFVVRQVDLLGEMIYQLVRWRDDV